MDARTRLFRWPKPYDLPGTNALFLQAVRDNCQYHYEHCSPYRAILDDAGFAPQQIKTDDDLAALPFLPTLLFKNHALFSMPRSRMLIRATSTGTRGKFSQVGFETSGLLCGLHMVLRIGALRKLFSWRPAHYIVLGYQPRRENKTAVTKTAFGATLFTPALSRAYALRYRDGTYQADLDSLIQTLCRHGRSAFPTRLMGFPSYTYFLLRRMEEQGIRLQLPAGSRILLGGGWKQLYHEQVEKEVLYQLAKRVLGIAEQDIIEFFGAVEHPILYCDCPRHHFHVPIYSRVIIRDVHTLQPLPNGRPGLVNLITPMVRATPLLSVMTDDLGVLHDGETCGCGIQSPYLELLGRVGLKDIKTCAAGAAELLREVKR